MRCHHFNKRLKNYGETDQWTDFLTVAGSGDFCIAAGREAMGIDWMTRKELSQAIPPAYTQFIGGQAIAAMRRAA